MNEIEKLDRIQADNMFFELVEGVRSISFHEILDKIKECLDHTSGITYKHHFFTMGKESIHFAKTLKCDVEMALYKCKSDISHAVSVYTDAMLKNREDLIKKLEAPRDSTAV